MAGVHHGRVLLMITVRRSAAIGDCIVATTVADALISMGQEVTFQCHRRIIPVIQRHPRITRVTERDAACQVDLDGVYENHPFKRDQHLQYMFMESAGVQLRKIGVDLVFEAPCRPFLTVPPAVMRATKERLRDHEKPWVFICPRSEDYNVRAVSDSIWAEAAKDIPGTKFWLGRTPAPRLIVDLHVQTIIQVMDWLSVADLLLTTDTGPSHIAAALGVPQVVIFQAVNPALRLPTTAVFESVSPDGLTCTNCQRYQCPINQWVPPCQKIDPNKIASAATKLLTPVGKHPILCA